MSLHEGPVLFSCDHNETMNHTDVARKTGLKAILLHPVNHSSERADSRPHKCKQAWRISSESITSRLDLRMQGPCVVVGGVSAKLFPRKNVSETPSRMLARIDFC